MKKLTNAQILIRAELFDQLADSCELSIDRFCSEDERAARRFIAQFLRGQDKYWTLQLNRDEVKDKKETP